MRAENVTEYDNSATRRNLLGRRSYTLTRTPDDLDHAMYCATCYAGSTGEYTVTVLMSIVGDRERYRIEDGRIAPFRDNATGLDWEPVYVLERWTAK